MKQGTGMRQSAVMNNTKQGETLTKWFWWSNWAPEKLEAWVEAKAAAGWSLVKVDRGLLRFHFVRTEPHQVRFCADFPVDANDEYRTIFEDAGWQLVSGGVGWQLWQMRYSGTDRPEAFTNLDPLIERNTRTLVILVGGLVGPLIAFSLWLPQGLLDSLVGKALMVVAIALSIFLALAVGATLSTIVKLRQRQRLTSE